MSEKESALKLVEKMFSNAKPEGMSRREAIDCAIVAVDEVLAATMKPKLNGVVYLGLEFDKYWLEVKYELEKLKA